MMHFLFMSPRKRMSNAMISLFNRRLTLCCELNLTPTKHINTRLYIKARRWNYYLYISKWQWIVILVRRKQKTKVISGQSIFVLESKITGVNVSVYLINLLSSVECTFQYQVIMLHETTHIISQEKQLQKS